jgi:hypothetical protein
MAELADAADLKSAGLKRPVGVRVPLSAPTKYLMRQGLIDTSQVGWFLGRNVTVTNIVTYFFVVRFLASL